MRDVWAGSMYWLSSKWSEQNDVVGVVQLLCCFRTKIASPGVHYPFLGPVYNNDEQGRQWFNIARSRKSSTES